MKKIKVGDRQTIQGLLKTLREEDMLARVDLRNTAVGNSGHFTSTGLSCDSFSGTIM